MDLVSQLQTGYNKLSRSNKKIADFLITDPEFFLNSSAAEIGTKSATSPATVVRFAKKLGYHSLEELKIAIARNSVKIEEVGELETIFSKTDDLEQIAQKLSNKLDFVVTATQNGMDFKKLEEAVRYIDKARTVYLYGIGASSLAAYDLFHKLNRADVQAIFSFDSHIGLEFSYHTKKSDVLIAFSYSGNTKEVILAAEQARKKGTKIVAVTRNNDSRLGQIADIVLLVPNTEELLRIGAISSKYSAMIVADLLFLGVVQRRYDEIEQSFIDTSKLAHKLKM